MQCDWDNVQRGKVMTQSIEQINQNLWESLAYDMKFNMELWYLGEIQGYNILAKFYINMSDEKIVRSSIDDKLQLEEVHTYEELLHSVIEQCGLQTSREQVQAVFPAKQLLDLYEKGQDRRVTGVPVPDAGWNLPMGTSYRQTQTGYCYRQCDGTFLYP